MKKGRQITTRDELTKFLLYTSPSGDIKVEAFLHDENIWLSQKKWQNFLELSDWLLQNT
jgi:hypothetical protein